MSKSLFLMAGFSNSATGLGDSWFYRLSLAGVYLKSLDDLLNILGPRGSVIEPNMLEFASWSVLAGVKFSLKDDYSTLGFCAVRLGLILFGRTLKSNLELVEMLTEVFFESMILLVEFVSCEILICVALGGVLGLAFGGVLGLLFYE